MNHFIRSLTFFIVIFSWNSTPVFAEESDKGILLDVKKLIKLKQFPEARKLLLPLANKGSAEAQYNLGVLYRNGYMLKKDYKRAYYWFQKAANQNHVESIFSVAMMTLRGQGTLRDLAAAEKLFVLAEAAGYKPATKQLKKLRERYAKKTLQEKDYVAFRKAIRTGNIVSVKDYLKRNIDVNRKDVNGYTSLMLAVESNQVKVIKLLPKSRLDYSAVNNHGETVLMIAIKNGFRDTALSFLKKAEVHNTVNMQDKLGNNALLLAIKFDQRMLVSPLLNAGANVDMVDGSNRNAYDVAKDRNNEATLKLLLDAGYKQKNKKKISPFVVEENSKSKSTEINPYANWSALMIASWRGDKKAVNDLIKTTKNINRVDEAGHSALSRAAWKGQTEIVNALLRHGADVNQKQADGSTALHWASQGGHIDVVKSLIKSGAKIDSQRVDEKTPLILSIINRKMKTALYLVLKKKGVNLQDKEGKTALMYACIEGNGGVVKLLLKRGAKLETVDNKKRNALWYAVNSSKAVIAKLLLDSGADANKRDADGSNLLTHAADTSNVKLVKILLNHNVKVDSKTKFGNNSLIIAVNNENQEIVQLLVEHKADVNLKNAIGDTALITAVKKGSVSMAEFLINAGADISKRNKQRKTAIDIAKASNNTSLIRLLEEKKKEKAFWSF